jgi:hypothetical protein
MSNNANQYERVMGAIINVNRLAPLLLIGIILIAGLLIFLASHTPTFFRQAPSAEVGNTSLLIAVLASIIIIVVFLI